MSLIKINNITAGYGAESVVENISLEINAGEIVGLLGLNGSGKSTFAKALCNIIPHTGEVDICGNTAEKLKAAELARLMSYIPQKSGISLDISVLDVVMMGFNPRLGIFDNPTRSMKEQATKVLETIGLADKQNSNYMLLSEGQKQLVILARALVGDSNFMLMDEPESALDFNYRYKLMSILRKWVASENRAGLVILHDVSLALNCCDRVVLLKDKKLVSEIDLKRDNLAKIEDPLSLIYGDVSLSKIKGKNGSEKFAMIYESEGI